MNNEMIKPTKVVVENYPNETNYWVPMIRPHYDVNISETMPDLDNVEPFGDSLIVTTNGFVNAFVKMSMEGGKPMWYGSSMSAFETTDKCISLSASFKDTLEPDGPVDVEDFWPYENVYVVPEMLPAIAAVVERDTPYFLFLVPKMVHNGYIGTVKALDIFASASKERPTPTQGLRLSYHSNVWSEAIYIEPSVD